MSIDTRDRRSSCLGFVTPGRVVYPDPDGGATVIGDRMQAAYAYRGVTPPALTIDGIDVTGIDSLSISVSGQVMAAYSVTGYPLSGSTANGVTSNVFELPGIGLRGVSVGGRGPG